MWYITFFFEVSSKPLTLLGKWFGICIKLRRCFIKKIENNFWKISRNNKNRRWSSEKLFTLVNPFHLLGVSTSESEIPPIALKFRIPMYFHLLITNMTIKIIANDIFKVKIKKNRIFHVFHITSINTRIGLREKVFRKKLVVCTNGWVSSHPVNGWISNWVLFVRKVFAILLFATTDHRDAQVLFACFTHYTISSFTDASFALIAFWIWFMIVFTERTEFTRFAIFGLFESWVCSQFGFNCNFWIWFGAFAEQAKRAQPTRKLLDLFEFRVCSYFLDLVCCFCGASEASRAHSEISGVCSYFCRFCLLLFYDFYADKQIRYIIRSDHLSFSWEGCILTKLFVQQPEAGTKVGSILV